MKTTSVSYFASGNQVNTQLTRQMTREFFDSKRFSPDLRKEGNGIGDAYEYNKKPVEGYVYLDHYYLEKRGDDYATVLCTREVEGTLEEVENALLEYYLANEGYKAQAIENRLQEEEQAYNPRKTEKTLWTKEEIDALVEKSLDHLCLFIQDNLGVKSGDVASQYFDEKHPIKEILNSYIRTEINFKS